MPVLATIPNLVFIFKDDYLIVAPVLLCLGKYPGTVDNRFPNRDIIAVGDEQHLIKLYCAAFVNL